MCSAIFDSAVSVLLPLWDAESARAISPTPLTKPDHSTCDLLPLPEDEVHDGDVDTYSTRRYKMCNLLPFRPENIRGDLKPTSRKGLWLPPFPSTFPSSSSFDMVQRSSFPVWTYSKYRKSLCCSRFLSTLAALMLLVKCCWCRESLGFKPRLSRLVLDDVGFFLLFDLGQCGGRLDLARCLYGDAHIRGILKVDAPWEDLSHAL